MDDIEYYNSTRQTFYAKLLKHKGVHNNVEFTTQLDIPSMLSYWNI